MSSSSPEASAGAVVPTETSVDDAVEQASPIVQGGNFLEALGNVDVGNKTVDEISNLVDQLSSQISNADIVAQNEALDGDVADMKQFMDRAQKEGLLDDEVDENAEDGTMLLKNKDGTYNPILDEIEKKRGELDEKWKGMATERAGSVPQQAIEAASSTAGADGGKSEPTVRKAVVIHIPLSGARDLEDTMRYCAGVVQDSVKRGEAPVCPLLQSVVVNMGKLTKATEIITAQTLAALRSSIPDLRVYVDLDKENTFSGKFGSKTVLRSLQAEKQSELEKSQRTMYESLMESQKTIAEGGEDAEEEAQKIDPQPNKSRVNRYTKDEDGNYVETFPDGVAGYASDGTAIPINNSGSSFNPKLPDVLGDMQYRNHLLTTPVFDPKDWYYRHYDKLRYLVVAYFGPENCNLKTKEYYMVVFGAAKTKGECQKIAEHVRKTKNCYHGRMFNIGVVGIGEIFATAPPRFAKDAKASYANPLHAKYMQSYIEEQKRATVELEQRVLDDEIRARENANSLQKQLQEKGMNPELAPTLQQAERDIEAQKRADAQAEMEARRQGALQKQKADEAATRLLQREKRAEQGLLLGEKSTETRPTGTPSNVQVAQRAAGARRKIAALRKQK